jgi:hypothetical protein
VPAHPDVIGSNIAGDDRVVVYKAAEGHYEGEGMDERAGGWERGLLQRLPFGVDALKFLRGDEGTGLEAVGEGVEGSLHAAAEFDLRQVEVVDVGGEVIDMDDLRLARDVPGVGTIFDGVVTDGDDDGGFGEELISGLIAKESDASVEEWEESTRDRSRALEGADGRHGELRQESADCDGCCGFACAHAQEQDWHGRGADEGGGLSDKFRWCRAHRWKGHQRGCGRIGFSPLYVLGEGDECGSGAGRHG